MSSIRTTVSRLLGRRPAPEDKSPACAPIPFPLILCVPGPWASRSELIERIISADPSGRFLFLGILLFDTVEKDAVELALTDADPALPRACAIAGQGQIGPDVQAALDQHQGVAYLHFAPDVRGEAARIRRFCEAMRLAGGIAVKVETAGLAHEWARWDTLLAGSLFDQYTAVVTLIGGDRYFYSCGMHNFGLPDCEVPDTLPLDEAAALMNGFNLWLLGETPVLAEGHTFSLTSEGARYRLTREDDGRHESDHGFYNPQGLWRLDAVAAPQRD